MNQKQFYLITLTIIILIFVNGCIQKEETISIKDEIIPTSDKDAIKWNVSDSLKFCLQKYVYGKDGNWVNLAEEHCNPLLPSGCLFGYGKEGYRETGTPFDYDGRSYDGLSSPLKGKFGVYCSAKFPKLLDNCVKEKVQCGVGEFQKDCSDSALIKGTYKNCWDLIPDTCMQVNIIDANYYGDMFYCLIY